MLPAIVLGGYLGAGKTTLLNRLLRHAGGRRIAVMVNDFGEAGIDADLIESQDGDVMNLAGGCICCSVGSDLIAALVALPARAPAPDLVLIETSGVALPGSVARGVRLAQGIEVDGVVVMADAETVRGRAADRYVGDTVLQQLRDADLLVLNKADLVEPPALDALHEWARAEAPRARVVEAIEADLPPELVLGLAGAAAPVQSLSRAGGGLFAGDPSRRRIAGRRPLAADVFESATLQAPGPVDARAAAAALADPSLGLLRAKGIVTDHAGGLALIQCVGPRWRVEPVAREAAVAGSVVVIGLRGRLDRARTQAALAARTH